MRTAAEGTSAGAAPTGGAPSGLPHKYVGGHPSVDFVNTADWTDRGPIDERLEDYARLTRWAEGAGLVPAATGAALRGVAAARPDEAAAVLAAAYRLRAALQRAFVAASAARASGTELDALAPFLTDAAAHRALVPAAGETSEGEAPEGAAARWAWRDAAADLAAPLWPVAWEAAALLASAEAARLRTCGAPNCGWMYVDRSRNGMRRWCQMEVCGTRAKSRRRAERSASRGS